MNSMITDEITAVNEALERNLGSQKYKIWFKNSTRMSLDQGYLKIAVPNTFVANWIEKHFAGEIRKAMKQAEVGYEDISFVIDPSITGREKKSFVAVTEKKVVNVAPGKKNESISNYKHKKLKLSLENFVVGSSNQLAYNASLAVANEEKSPFNPLFIHGGYGVGKTHLMQGICNQVCKNRPLTNWLYLSAEDFANQFVLALKTKKLEAFRNRMRKTELLAIDDIHFLASKPSTQQEFLHTFNSIDLAGKQVVLVSDAHPKFIGQLCEKLVNRFVSGMVVKIDEPDFKTRAQICRQFAANMNKDIPESIINYIAENVKSNVRELEGAMLKLTAFAALQNHKINLELAKIVLTEHLSRTDPIVHISDIESIVAAYFCLTPQNLRSSKKNRDISLARHFSMYLARKHTKMSFPEIGRFMGNKNHATVLLACKKVEQSLKSNTLVNWQSPAGNRAQKTMDIIEDLEGKIAG